MEEKRIGIVYPGDGVLDREFWQFAPPAVSLHLTRTRFEDGGDSLDRLMEEADGPAIGEAAKTLRFIKCASVAYACTSISFIGGPAGERKILDRLEEAAGAPATTSSTAIVAACRTLGLKNAAVVAPYEREITSKLSGFLEESGIGVVSVGEMGLGFDRIGDVTDEAVIELGRSVDLPGADGIIISCTNLRTIAAIPALESALGKPVVSSTQATVWHACKLAGLDRSELEGVGSLYKTNSLVKPVE